LGRTPTGRTQYVLAGFRAPLDAEPDLEVAGEAKTHVSRSS
jgi:hypothetical protein